MVLEQCQSRNQESKIKFIIFQSHIKPYITFVCFKVVFFFVVVVICLFVVVFFFQFFFYFYFVNMKR